MHEISVKGQKGTKHAGVGPDDLQLLSMKTQNSDKRRSFSVAMQT